MPEDNSAVTPTVSSTTPGPMDPTSSMTEAQPVDTAVPVSPVMEPMNQNPVASDPMMPVSDPMTSDPMASNPTMSDPMVSDPVTTDPGVSNPVTSDPVVSDPIVSDPVAADTVPDSQPVQDLPVANQSFEMEPPSQVIIDVATRIGEAENILIALSGDPSVDELAAAIGLSIYLDKLGKNATAIYSGSTPNALEFLNPDETFESSADALQDFVIALNKEKADHLRYKLDGDYVKVYITPYRTRLSEEDLEFSYGDFNIDLVLALDVANGIDLDAALREHGRIMHDASVINITTGNPGRFGEIEWSDKKASSVSEMIAKLLYGAKTDVPLGKEEATAFLTGIVAATNRFSNANTTPETMQVASRLMESGANQQLISKNITPDVDNEMFSLLNMPTAVKKDDDPTKLEVEHEEGSELDNEIKDNLKEINATITEKESTLLDDLKAAEASLAQAGSETTPDLSNQPVRLDDKSAESVESIASEMKNLSPSDLEASNDYGNTSEPALEPELPKVSTSPDSNVSSSNNPAEKSAPEVSSTPEINGVPEISFSSEPSAAVLPPAPAPPIDMDNTLTPDMDSLKSLDSLDSLDSAMLSSDAQITPDNKPATDSNSYLGPQPAMQDQVYAPQASDPSAFKIPGM